MIVLRAPSNLWQAIRIDLQRPHPFAYERVGFLACRPAALANSGTLLCGIAYMPVADDHYIRDETVGACIGSAAFRAALTSALDGGRQGVTMLHVHMHHHSGRPYFSEVDLAGYQEFVPDFFNVAPAVPHGAVVLSIDAVVGLCWLNKQDNEPIDRISSVGPRLDQWRPQ